MKATDIMIGDWVKLCNPRGEWIDNSKIDANLFGIFLRDGEDGVVRFKPIPLTPEILEKNGFEPKGSLREKESGSIIKFFEKADRIGSDNRLLHALTASISGNRCSIGIFTDYGLNVRYNSRLTKTIYYVHELQQALRVCRLEDMADNFKV